MDLRLAVIVELAKARDAIELALAQADRALDDAIRAGIAAGVTIAEIEEETGLDEWNPSRLYD